MSMHSLSFAAQVTDLPGLSNAEFLQALEFDRSADATLRAAAAKGNVAAFTRTWQTLHRETNDPGAATAGFGERALWSRLAFPEEEGLARVIEATAGNSAKKPEGARRPVNKPAANWSQRVSHMVYELTMAVCSEETRPFAVLAALEFLSHSGHRLPAETFFKLWRHTLSELLMWPTELYPDPTIPADVELAEYGEIPFVGGLMFREIARSSKLVKAGLKFLTKELDDKTDTDGTPHAEVLPRLPLWLAPLVRSSLMMKRYGHQGWSSEQANHLSNVIDRAILSCRPDGRAALSNGSQIGALPILSTAAEYLDLGLVESTNSYLRAMQRTAAGKPPKRIRSNISTMPSNQSDWARFALLKSDLSVQSDSVAITHHLPQPQLDVVALGNPLIHGDWQLKLKIDDAIVELADEWSCVCWQSDPDGDYIELQMAGPGKLRVERVVMLSRKERFLIIADAIHGVTGKSGKGSKPLIQYESRLSLCPGMEGSSEGTTREGRITSKRFKARVIPLALPQDKVNSTPNEFAITGNEIILRQVGEGEGLFAPLAFVWHPERTRVDATWRSLTVTEESQVVGPDIAVGYRLKLGPLQLLFSRSLKRNGKARAVLGHHTRNETVIATFDKDGDVEPIMQVE